MKICGYCGSQLDDAAIACAYCGRVLTAGGDPEAAVEQQRQQQQLQQQQQQQSQTTYSQGPGWQQAGQPNYGQPQGYGNPQQPYGQGYNWQQNRQGSEGRLNVCGLISFIFGLVSLLFGAFYCIPCIVAIILGIVALVQQAKRPNEYKLKGFAIAGLVLGIVFLIFWGAIFIYVFRLLAEYPYDYTDSAQLYEYLMEQLYGGFTLFR